MERETKVTVTGVSVITEHTTNEGVRLVGHSDTRLDNKAFMIFVYHPGGPVRRFEIFTLPKKYRATAEEMKNIAFSKKNIKQRGF